MDHGLLILDPEPRCTGDGLSGSSPVPLVGLQELRSVHGGSGAHAGSLTTVGNLGLVVGCLGFGVYKLARDGWWAVRDQSMPDWCLSCQADLQKILLAD
jgi:hypothetical protein